MKPIFFSLLLFTFFACTKTRHKEPENYYYSLFFTDTILKVHIDSSFSRLPFCKDSDFSDASIYKCALTDTISLTLKKQLCKLETVYPFYNNEDTFYNSIAFLNSIHIYKLSQLQLMKNLRSYVLLMNEDYGFRKILLLNVDPADRMVSICVLGGRPLRVNDYVRTKFLSNTRMTLTYDTHAHSDTDLSFLFFNIHWYHNKIEKIDLELDVFGKWEKIRYVSKERKGYHFF